MTGIRQDDCWIFEPRWAKIILQIELYVMKALHKKCPQGINDTFKVLKINMCHQGSISDDAMRV